MTVIVWLIPIALLLGLAGLGAFLWSLKSGQYEDLEGAANRILFDDQDNQDDETDPADEADPDRPRDTGDDRPRGRDEL